MSGYLLKPLAWAALLVLAGCAATPTPTDLPETTLQRAAVPLQLSAGAGTVASSRTDSRIDSRTGSRTDGRTDSPADTPAYGWRDLVRQPRLAQLVELALQGNRDLRVTVLNVQRAQAQLSVAEANRLPTLGAGLTAGRAPNSRGEQASAFALGLQVSSWELDFFGRLAKLSDSAAAQLLASQAGRRAAELALAATVVQAALVLQADDELLVLARQSLASREQSLKLAQLRESVGAASLLDLQLQQGLAAQARATLAQLTRQQAQNANALALLLGQPVPPALLSTVDSPLLESDAWLAEVPAGLSSTVLLRRPDVIAAEQTLRAADANIAAARAAFWPAITLTGQAGQASPQLSGLFQGGNFGYTLAAQALIAVFDAGRRQATVDGAIANRDIARAQYERAIQSAFRDTADGLVGLATWRDQRLAVAAQREAARGSSRLVELRTRQGAASALEQLEAERSLWATEQAVVQVRLAELLNRVALFKALGS